MCDLLLFSFVVRVALIGIPSVKALFPTCYDLHFQGGLFPVSGEMNVFKDTWLLTSGYFQINFGKCNTRL